MGYTSRRRGKEMAAPKESPRAKKKVMRAPAVSPSLAGTSLLERVGKESVET